MDNKLERETLLMKERESNNKKKELRLLGFPVWKLCAYFIIYSILGFAIETLFGLVTKGVLESRQSFLYGPFCGIYGIGAIVMIVGLQYFKKNNYTLFFGGFIIGSVVEYAISLIGEFIFHIKWWDYSDIPFNINGRICILFSFFWGILAIYLMTYIHPKVERVLDRLCDKLGNKMTKIITTILTIFLMIDCMITGFALKMFFTRLVTTYHIEIQNVDDYLEEYEKIYENLTMKNIIDTFFNDRKMLMTFPNIKVNGKEGEIIHIRDVLKELPTYYVRIFTPKRYQKIEVQE